MSSHRKPFSSPLLSRIPILPSLHELDRSPRQFLLFIVFNVVSWQCIVGPALVLFARKIEMPASYVGFLISFMPCSTLLVLFTVNYINRHGPKRMMFIAWLLRNLITCTIFLTPVAIAFWGAHAGWYVVIGTTLGFCILRAIGSGGWFPWLHEVVPESQRAIYFSADASVTQVLNVVVLLVQAFVLHGDPGMYRFLAIYALGIGAGLLSLIWMARVPGGGPITHTDEEAQNHSPYRTALADRRFLAFVVTASFCFSCISWFGSSVVMYMRDALGLFPDEIMSLTVVGSMGILMTIRFWARFAEHSGSGRAMSKTLVGHSLAALACIVVLPEHRGTVYGLLFVILCSSIFGSAFWMVTHRAMLAYFKPMARAGYTAIWTAGTALSLTITPIAAGHLIDWFGLSGFHVCFLLSGLGGLACAIVCLWVVREKEGSEPSLAGMLSPAAPFKALGRIVWITLGMDESNRPGPV